MLSVVAELGQPRAVAAMTAALALACVVCRRYRGAALMALSVPIAAVITELLLKPYIGLILDLLSSGLQRSRERRSLSPPHSREGAWVHED